MSSHHSPLAPPHPHFSKFVQSGVPPLGGSLVGSQHHFPEAVAISGVGGDEGALQHIQVHCLVLSQGALLTQPQIDDDQSAVQGADNEVGGSEVPVHHAAVMQPGDDLSQLLQHLVQLFSGKGLFMEHALQGVPLNPLHVDFGVHHIDVIQHRRQHPKLPGFDDPSRLLLQAGRCELEIKSRMPVLLAETFLDHARASTHFPFPHSRFSTLRMQPRRLGTRRPQVSIGPRQSGCLDCGHLCKVNCQSERDRLRWDLPDLCLRTPLLERHHHQRANRARLWATAGLLLADGKE
mmetsp:Transcript_15384/g.46443  ORF Transcript_15384/g.46443 Transcript_15384/m.46443 type:complete len:292 (+) Transcript_15384:228-1103(+)